MSKKRKGFYLEIGDNLAVTLFILIVFGTIIIASILDTK